MQTKKQIITIAGRPGSGKSTTAKTVAAKLGYEHFSSGDLFRQIAEERKVDILAANKIAESDKSIDLLVDERLRTIGQNQDKIVVDSRTAWHWMPQSFKVFLDLDLNVAAKRIISNMEEERMQSEQISHDPAEYAKVLEERLGSETKRYLALYQINPYDVANFDLVVDTNVNNVDQVVAIILAKYEEWQKS